MTDAVIDSCPPIEALPATTADAEHGAEPIAANENPTENSPVMSASPPPQYASDFSERILAIKATLDNVLSASSDALLVTLRDLQALNTSVTPSVLASTQIGLAVNKVAKAGNVSNEVKELAKAIVAVWKQQVKATSSSSSGTRSNGSATSTSPTPVESPKPTLPEVPPTPPSVHKKRKHSESKEQEKETPVSKKSAKAPAAKPTVDTSKTSTPSSVKSPIAGPAPSTPAASSQSYKLGKTGNETRNKIQQLLFQAIGGTAGEWETELAVRLEVAMFGLYNNDTGAQYKTKYRELAMNLKDPSNPDINDALLTGAWTPEQVVTMTGKDLASQSLKAQREAEAKWAREEARSDLGKLNGLTDMFRCGKCKERKCTYYQMQTRSADEPMTVFVRCTVCGNRWKM